MSNKYERGKTLIEKLGYKKVENSAIAHWRKEGSDSIIFWNETKPDFYKIDIGVAPIHPSINIDIHSPRLTEKEYKSGKEEVKEMLEAKLQELLRAENSRFRMEDVRCIGLTPTVTIDITPEKE